jgi:hypothetical protein
MISSIAFPCIVLISIMIPREASFARRATSHDEIEWGRVLLFTIVERRSESTRTRYRSRYRHIQAHFIESPPFVSSRAHRSKRQRTPSNIHLLYTYTLLASSSTQNCTHSPLVDRQTLYSERGGRGPVETTLPCAASYINIIAKEGADSQI